MVAAVAAKAEAEAAVGVAMPEVQLAAVDGGDGTAVGTAASAEAAPAVAPAAAAFFCCLFRWSLHLLHIVPFIPRMPRQSIPLPVVRGQYPPADRQPFPS